MTKIHIGSQREIPTSFIFWLLSCNFFFILLIFLIDALKIPFTSMPGGLKKFLSSADKKEFTITSGIESKGTKSLFSIAYSAINFPSCE